MRVTAERNWAGNHVFSADRVERPTTVEELRRIITGNPRVRALGSRHSFNDLADSAGGVLIELGGLDLPLDIDRDASIVWAPAGMRYGDLASTLQAEGLALHNLASLPHISLAGTVATGTHGSGIRNGSLATAVAGLELVTAAGDLLVLRRGDADFDGAVVSLGALGIVTRVALDVQPTFQIEQRVFVDLPMDAVENRLLEILGVGYSTSLFTRWSEPTIDQLWVKAEPGDDSVQGFGGTPSAVAMHPIAGVDARFTTDQLQSPGPWLDRLPHFKLEFTPSAGEEIQSEFFVDASDGPAAFAVVKGFADRIAPLLYVCEIRAVAADELWLSGAYGRDTVAFHFTWQSREDEVREVLVDLEAALAEFGARPHWGKVFTAGAEQIRPLYPRFDAFLDLRDRLDPEGRFRNDYTDRVIDGTGS